MNTQILTQTCTKVKGVFTKRLMKTLSVPITSVALLIGFVGNSSAFEIVEMKSTYGTYSYSSSSGYITHYAQVETNPGFEKVEWYVDDVKRSTTNGEEDGEDTVAYFHDSFYGHGPGKRYEIKAIAYPWDGDAVSKSYTITVYKDVVKYSEKSSPVEGYLEIAECGWRGRTSAAEMSAYVYNDSNRTIDVFFKFEYEVVHLKNVGEDKVLERRIELNNYGSLAKGKEASCCYHDYYTLPPDNKPGVENWWTAGERAKLGVQITVDVGPEWVLKATAYYDFVED